jgi:VanZ family protein
VHARVPSITDIASQTAGAIAGFCIWLAAGPPTTAWLRQTMSPAVRDRWSRVLTVATALWLFASLAPFDITVDVGELAARVRAGAISPVPLRNFDPRDPRHVWDALAELASAVPVGMFFLMARPAPSRLRAWAAGAGLVGAVEAAQVFIVSHAAQGTDLVFGTVGVAVGVWLGSRVRPARATAALAPASGVSMRALAIAAGCSLAIAAYHWLPYDFAVDEDAIRRKLDALSLLPFAAYAAGSYLNALADITTKLSLALPLGIACALVNRDHRYPPPLAAALLLACVALFAVIEAGQLFLPSRIPDVTDVLTGVAGAFAGFAVGRWLSRTPDIGRV